MNYTCYIFDLDDTLLDFKAGEEKGLRSVFSTFHKQPVPFEDWLTNYHEINQATWQQIEAGALAQPLLDTRFAKTFATFGQAIDGVAAEAHFRQVLDTNDAILPGSKELLASLADKGVKLIAGTNGKTATQYQRLAMTGFDRYFQHIVISGEIGHAKPSRAFFDHIFHLYPQYQPSDFIMIGDSLQSDIVGAKQAQIDSIWLTNQTTTSAIKPTYQVASLAELAELLL